MGIVSLVSAKASPGATTTALLVAARWAGERMLVEADESGGVLAARLGLGAEPSSLELAAAGALSAESVARHAQRGWRDVPVLVAPSVPHQVQATLREAADDLADLAAHVEVDLVVDAGRLRVGGPAWPLMQRSAFVALVARPRLEEFAAVAARAQELRAAGVRVGLVVLRDGPYDPVEFSTVAEVELLGVLDLDARAVAGLERGTDDRHLLRSALWRETGDLVDVLQSISSGIQAGGVP